MNVQNDLKNDDIDAARDKLAQLIKKCVENKLALNLAGSKAEIARNFGIQPPSLHSWMSTGRVDRDRIPMLMRYFSDVSRPQDWGLEKWPDGMEIPKPEDSFRPKNLGRGLSALLTHPGAQMTPGQLMHELSIHLGVPVGEPLTSEEHELISLYRGLTPAMRKKVTEMIRLMAP